MKNLISTSLIFLIAFSFTHCTIQKRTVNKGYHVQWHIGNKTSHAKQSTQQDYGTNETTIASNETVDSKEDQKFQNNLVVEIQHESTEQISIEDDHQTALTKPNLVKAEQDVKQESTHQRIVQKIKKHARKVAVPMDGELVINVILMLVFLGLSILFLLLALKAAGIMLFVYWGLCALSFILFVTQLIDVIMW